MKRPQGEQPNETVHTHEAGAVSTMRALAAPETMRLQPSAGPSGPRSPTERSRPAAAGVRATFVLAPEDLELLQGEKFRRRMAAGGRLRGSAGDFSSLVREAIRKTYGKP